MKRDQQLKKKLVLMQIVMMKMPLLERRRRIKEKRNPRRLSQSRSFQEKVSNTTIFRFYCILTSSQFEALAAKDLTSLVAAQHFKDLISQFVRAIHVGTIDLEHSSIIISQYEKFGADFDLFVKVLVQDLCDEGLYVGSPIVAIKILAQTFEAVSRIFH